MSLSSKNPQSQDTIHLTSYRRKSRFKLNWKYVFIVGMGVGITLGSIYYYLERTPQLTIPTHALPNPNAYDLYQTAFAEMGKVDAANRAKGMPPSTLAPESKRTLTEKQALLDSYSKGLQALRQGFSLEYTASPERSIRDMRISSFAQARSAARLLLLESNVYEQKRQWGKAMESRLDALKLGTDLPHGGGLMPSLVGIAICAIGHKQIEPIISNLNATEARTALKRLETLSEGWVGLPKILEEEKYQSQAMQMEIFNSHPWNWHYAMFRSALEDDSTASDSEDGAEKSPPKGIITRLGEAIPPLFISKQAVLNSLTAKHDAGIARASVPYTKRPSMREEGDEFFASDNMLFRHAFSRAIFLDMLTLRIALRLYYLEQKQFPNTLEELVKRGILKALPTDPFATDGKFRYRRQGATYLLYSVGPDGKDDNGTSITNLNVPTERMKYQPQADSVGDIVVGVNVQ